MIQIFFFRIHYIITNRNIYYLNKKDKDFDKNKKPKQFYNELCSIMENEDNDNENQFYTYILEI